MNAETSKSALDALRSVVASLKSALEGAKAARRAAYRELWELRRERDELILQHQARCEQVDQLMPLRLLAEKAEQCWALWWVEEARPVVFDEQLTPWPALVRFRAVGRRADELYRQWAERTNLAADGREPLTWPWKFVSMYGNLPALVSGVETHP